MLLRLPQDLAVSTPGDRPDLPRWTRSVDEYAAAYERAVGNGGDVRQRADSLWGLIARGTASLEWVSRQLASQDPVHIADAAGVLMWVGVPDPWRQRLRRLADLLPDGEAADNIYVALGPDPADESETMGSGQLLDGGSAPFTNKIWFVEAPLDEVVEAVRRWHAGLGRTDDMSTLRAPLPRLLDQLEPFSIPSWKQLLVETTSRWTAVFSQGSDIYTADNAGRFLNCRVLRTNYSPHVIRAGKVVNFGDRSFWLTDPASPVGHRVVQASYQSRWTWELSGEEQSFEDVAAYGSTRIPDRFTLARLNAYCAALGIHRADPSFYGPRGVLLVEDTRGWERKPRNVMPSHAWRSANLS